MAVAATEPAVPPDAEDAPELRRTFDRPTWVFNVIVVAALAVYALTSFDPTTGLTLQVTSFAAACLIVVLGVLWIASFISCVRRHHLGHGWRSAGSWIAAPTLVLAIASFHLAVGGIDNLAFRFSTDEMTADAQQRLASATDEPVNATPDGELTVGMLTFDSVWVYPGGADTTCAGRLGVTYEYFSGFLTIDGYLYSPGGQPSCWEGAQHLTGDWYRLPQTD